MRRDNYVDKHRLPLAALYRQGRLKGWLDSIIEMSENGKACVFSVDLRTGENCIGQVSLVQKDHSVSWNLAFWFHPSYWGRGLALETARAVIHHAFTVTSIEEIWAGAAPWNQRSMKTLLKLGLTPIQDAGAPTGKSGTEDGTEGAFRALSISRDRWMCSSMETRGDR